MRYKLMVRRKTKLSLYSSFESFKNPRKNILLKAAMYPIFEPKRMIIRIKTNSNIP